MKTVIIRKKPLTRQFIANPNSDMTFNERLIKGNAIDLRDNHVIEELENGYWVIKPQNSDKNYI